MTHTVTYRILEDEAEKIISGDQWRFISLPDEFWVECDLMVGHRLRDLKGSRVLVRRKIAHESTTQETPPT